MNRYFLLIILAAIVGLSLTALAGPVQDTDVDGVPDAFDNCPINANPSQADTDGDSYGNACDCDFVDPPPGDGFILGNDVAKMLGFINTTEALYDVSGDGFVLGEDVYFCMTRFATTYP